MLYFHTKTHEDIKISWVFHFFYYSLTAAIPKKIVGHSGAMTLTEKVFTHLDMQVLVDAINKTLENKDNVTADAESA